MIPFEPVSESKTAAKEILGRSGVGSVSLAIVLGSGWQLSAEVLGDEIASIEASSIQGFGRTVVPGHSGLIRLFRLPNGKVALVIGSRIHFYERRYPPSVVHPVRVAAECGAGVIILTNGAGAINEEWSPGQAVLISDQLNLTSASPLEGPRFVDLTDLYSRRLRAIARKVDPTLDEGVYVQFPGPQYETPAEVQMAKTMGGHIVGMSTALEAIAAREAGMEILGLSLITNMAAGISPHPLSHQEVIDTGKAAEPTISKLLTEIVHAI